MAAWCGGFGNEGFLTEIPFVLEPGIGVTVENLTANESLRGHFVWTERPIIATERL